MGPLVEFLSAEWVAALDEALKAARVTTDGAPPLVVQQVVEHPDGLRSTYRIRIDSRGASALGGHSGDATVTYRQDYEVARGIATGELDAHVEFLMGRVVVSGEVQALVDYRATLELVHGALRDVRAGTRF